MANGPLVSWLRDNLGRLNLPAYILAIFVGGIFPFLLYCASSAESFGLAPNVGLDTSIVAVRWWLIPLFLLVLLLAFGVSFLQTPHLAIVIRKLRVTTRGRGLTFPLLLSGFAFYLPILWLARTKELGSAEGELFVVATPVIQSSYSVYLVVLSVTALIRYFFITAVVQTDISGFTRNLTTDLQRLERDGKGRLTISLPWLAFGKLSLDPALFAEFSGALGRCFSNRNISIEVYTLSIDALRRGAKKSLDNPANDVTAKTIQAVLRYEAEIRKLANGRIKEVVKADLMGCVIINEKLYAVHTLLHKAREDAHLGNAFISMEIDDKSICAEYRRQLKSIADKPKRTRRSNRSHTQ